MSIRNIKGGQVVELGWGRGEISFDWGNVSPSSRRIASHLDYRTYPLRLLVQSRRTMGRLCNSPCLEAGGVDRLQELHVSEIRVMNEANT